MTDTEDLDQRDSQQALDHPAERHRWPDGADVATVDAASKVTEALETVERARGHLYEWHQLIGSANDKLNASVQALRATGHTELADAIERDLVGRNVLPGRWTFQAIEEFDEGYYEVFRTYEGRVRRSLLCSRRHVYEAAMKEAARSVDESGAPLPWHAATPDSGT
ncbi:hypothetical protein GCM10011581_43400 [Saccharopolyspora subtropica]|uniref:Uncharacterized protein n=1 Tax=Saccharopolyspora thermophila TaxID=89367 RepID=A0A917K680_9PSEU|nr:hypothetical protein [Saccharopolyspora subtropica]GGJ01512.1 hypothetical protein GCM10011581_43400 [Saccharopolyspora subtropica]